MRVGVQRHAPTALSPRKTRYPLYRRLSGLQGWPKRVRKIPPSPAFDPRSVQPVASRYTDCSRQNFSCFWQLAMKCLLACKQSASPVDKVERSSSLCGSLFFGVSDILNQGRVQWRALLLSTLKLLVYQKRFRLELHKWLLCDALKLHQTLCGNLRTWINHYYNGNLK